MNNIETLQKTKFSNKIKTKKQSANLALPPPLNKHNLILKANFKTKKQFYFTLNKHIDLHLQYCIYDAVMVISTQNLNMLQINSNHEFGYVFTPLKNQTM